MSFATSATALQFAGLASNTIGSYYSAKNQKASFEYQAHMADLNAKLSEMSAQQELLKGERQIGALTLKAGQLKSSQRAAMAANGIDLGVGSAAEIQASTDLMKEIDANTIHANSVRDAWGFRMQGVNFQNDAIMKRGAASAINPGMAAFGTLLTGAGSVAQSWYMMNKGTRPDDIAKANKSDDPIGALGDMRGWW